MKKLLIALVVIFILMLPCAYAADFTETAQPTAAEVTVNGETVDFCAYNLYGSNYFMLRDVAMALMGTEKSFSVTYYPISGDIYISEYMEYEPIGTEFQQSAEASPEAIFSVQDISRRGEGVLAEANAVDYTLVGYNINGSNYFKIRDIARIFDFYVGYEDGHITVDTSKAYEPEMPYEPLGECIGTAHEANLALFINEMPIVSYYATCDTAYSEEQLERLNKTPRLNGVYINAAELDNYGFDKTEDGENIYLTRNRNKAFGILDGVIINSEPSGICEAVGSPPRVYLDGEAVRTVTADGMPLIAASELIKYGGIYANYHYADYSGNILYKRINIDFLRSEIEKSFEALGDGEEIKISEYGYADISDEAPQYLWDKNSLVYGTLTEKDGMWNYTVRYGLSSTGNERYIGGFKDGKFSGSGIWERAGSSAGAGSSALNSWEFQRGDFENGELINGVQLKSASGMPNVTGYRKEGNMQNGYIREFFVFQGQNAKYRFGYRAVREGEIEDGEYCGYYREYNDDGEVIFDDLIKDIAAPFNE